MVLFLSHGHSSGHSHYTCHVFFVAAGTVKPVQVSPVELVDYLWVKLFNSELKKSGGILDNPTRTVLLRRTVLQKLIPVT